MACSDEQKTKNHSRSVLLVVVVVVIIVEPVEYVTSSATWLVLTKEIRGLSLGLYFYYLCDTLRLVSLRYVHSAHN